MGVNIFTIAEDTVELRIKTFNPTNVEENIMFSGVHVNRLDCAEDMLL